MAPGWGTTLQDTTLQFDDLYPGTDAQVVMRDPRTVTKGDQSLLAGSLTYTQDEKGQLKVTGVNALEAARTGCVVAGSLIRSWVMYDRDGNPLELPAAKEDRGQLLMDLIPENVSERIVRFAREKGNQATVPTTASAN